VTILSISQNWFRNRRDVKTRGEWDYRFEIFADCLVVFFVVALTAVFIISFLTL
jgi:hypothetical protein